MPDDILDLADRLWLGEVASGEYHPVGHQGGLAEICDGVAFVPSFANVSAFVTPDGLVLWIPEAPSWPRPSTTSSGGGVASG